jgi:uncharacterized protein (DUF1501 family)
MTTDRRVFLKHTGLALVGGAFLPKVFVRIAEGATTQGKHILVAIFQRGAVDGLNMVIPYGEQAYYSARRSIAVPRPGAEGGALDLDGFFGLHPALTPLHPLFKDRSLAFVQAVGSPDPSRSHFDAQDFMETGTPGRKSTTDGFLARALSAPPEKEMSPLRAVAMSPSLPRILAGDAGAVAMTNLAQFGVRAGAASSIVSGSFEAMYGEAVAGTLAPAARDSFEAQKILRSTAPEKLAPQHGAQYPRSPLGDALKQISQLIRANVGLEVAFADVGGWDTHAAQGGTQGQLANQFRNFGNAISAFARDLGTRMADITLVTMSEFGRTLHENGNRGTDHGHANVMMVLGGGVKGGKVYGKWPGLRRENLFEQRDLAVTTDFRDVYGEILSRRMGVRNLARVFPGYDSNPSKWPGVA